MTARWPAARRPQVRAEAERPGVQGDQGDAVGEHVVHLAGDPGAFVPRACVGAQLLRGLGLLGPLAAGTHQLAPRPE